MLDISELQLIAYVLLIVIQLLVICFITALILKGW